MAELDADNAPTIDRATVPEIPGYREFTFIGAGGASTVWRAFQEDFDRWVAVKVLKPGSAEGPALAHFEREKRISASLGSHPFIVQVFATGRTTDGRPFMAMDLCERGSLSNRITQDGAFSVDATIDVGIKIASALQAAHDKEVLHRDIKPQNILVSEYGPALTDFGISRSSGATEWTESLLQLSMNHAAPETFLDKPTERSDIYALGSTLFTMLAGRPAFARSPNETSTQFLVRLERDPLPPFRRVDVPAGLREAIERAMAKRPEDRFASARAFSEALHAVQFERARGASTIEPIAQTAPEPVPGPDTPPTLPRLPTAQTTPVAADAPAISADTTTLRPREEFAAPPLPPMPVASDLPTVESVSAGATEAEADETRVRSRRAPEPAPLRPTRRRGDRNWWALGWQIAGLVAGIVVVVAVVVLVASGGRSDSDGNGVSKLPVVDEGTPTEMTFNSTSDPSVVEVTWTDTSEGTRQPFVVVVDADGEQKPGPRVEAGQTETLVKGLDDNPPYCIFVTTVSEGDVSRSASVRVPNDGVICRETN